MKKLLFFLIIVRLVIILFVAYFLFFRLDYQAEPKIFVKQEALIFGCIFLWLILWLIAKKLKITMRYLEKKS